MKLMQISGEHWGEVREIYLEAFPKAERKPFSVVKRSVKKGKAQLLTALEDGQLLGFVMVIPYRDMVMVDYLAVSGKIRSRGTGSRIMEEVCRMFHGRKILLLIERLDDGAENSAQRVARRKFYLKNGFVPAGFFIRGTSGEMEVLRTGGTVSSEEYLTLQKYALGSLFFKLSGIRLVR